MPVATWPHPIDLQLGALYLLPEQQEFVKVNLGYSAATMRRVASIRLDVLRRTTGQVIATKALPATPAAFAAQRERLPLDLRDDLRNLLLADLNVSALPIQPFDDPQRNWIVRATVLDKDGKEMSHADSQTFCRLAHDPPQPAITRVEIKGRDTFVNGKAWMPWGGVYGFVPVYAGPADPGAGKYRDLHNLAGWTYYDLFTPEPYNRARNDLNCLRYVAGSISDFKVLEEKWQKDNLYCSSAFIVPQPVFSLDELYKGAGGREKLDAYAAKAKSAPMVVSIAPGIEEVFGLFHEATPEKLAGLAEVAKYLRAATGKPIMVGHGGGWNRFEFEKVPFFDIYDPETEPTFPANLHVELSPLLGGRDTAIWLRPQMYESVPYERWRFHTYVELMRGCRGWQFAHGPGDQSLFRGLHGEMAFMTPIVTSTDPGPGVEITPWVEHFSRRYNGKTYLIAATTHAMRFGRWKWDEAPADKPVNRSATKSTTQSADEAADALAVKSAGRARVTGYADADDESPASALRVHGVEYMPDARAFPKGSTLIQWVFFAAAEAPRSIVLIPKTDGRFVRAASWGAFDFGPIRADRARAASLLRTLYRQSSGFMGWGDDLVPAAMAYLPEKCEQVGDLPAAGHWFKLALPLDRVGADERLLDGAAFMHEGGRLKWGRTTIVTPDGVEHVLWGDAIGLPPEQLAKTRFQVEGLKRGTKVRVLFEDREVVAGDGSFTDDLRGEDLYQRYGGMQGYGDTPVALHVYEIGP